MYGLSDDILRGRVHLPDLVPNERFVRKSWFANREFIAQIAHYL
jgi:hypothetical protein